MRSRMTGTELAILRQLFVAFDRGVWPGNLVAEVYSTTLNAQGFIERGGQGWRITEGGVAALFGTDQNPRSKGAPDG